MDYFSEISFPYVSCWFYISLKHYGLAIECQKPLQIETGMFLSNFSHLLHILDFDKISRGYSFSILMKFYQPKWEIEYFGVDINNNIWSCPTSATQGSSISESITLYQCEIGSQCTPFFSYFISSQLFRWQLFMRWNVPINVNGYIKTICGSSIQ